VERLAQALADRVRAKTQAEARGARGVLGVRDGPVRAFRFYDWQEHAAVNQLLPPTGAPTVQ